MERQLGSQYVLRGNLGRGAMGQVFRGTDKQGRELAFKVLHPELAADANMVSRFVQERSLLLSVDSPNVVRVLDLVVEGDTLAIVMELVAGQDLRALLKRRGTLGSAEACRLGAGIARGLAAIHAAGIVHRDIKPENVLISLDGPVPVPKVTDFGVSSLVDAEKARTTMLVGTPQYIAPEISEGGAPSAAADLYALGILLYELASGTTPFAGGPVMTVLRRHSELAPQRPAGIPDGLWDIIGWLLAKSPQQRPPSAERVAELLEGLAASLDGADAVPGRSAPSAAAAAPRGPVPTPVRATMPVPAGQPTRTGPHHTATPLLPGGPPGQPPLQFAAQPPAAQPRTNRKALWISLVSLLAVLALTGGGIAVVNLLGRTNQGGGLALPTATQAPTTAAPAGGTASDGSSAQAADGNYPNVVGQTLTEAMNKLENLAAVTVVDRVDSSQPVGTVLEQQPPAGTTSVFDVTLVVGSPADATYLDSLVANSGKTNFTLIARIAGTSYAHSLQGNVCLTASGDHESTVYQLAGAYGTFTATAGITDTSYPSHTTALLEVVADGRTVYSQQVVAGKSFPVKVDVTGIKELKITWLNKGCTLTPENGQTIIALGGARLEPPGAR